MIKNYRPRKDSTFKQGYYSPKYREKYIGNYPIIFRSSYEQKFCIFLDNHPQIIRWASEPDVHPFPIPYLDEIGKERRYYPDFYAEFKGGNGVKRFIFEIKSNSALVPPKAPSHKKGKRKTTLLKENVSYNRAMTNYLRNINKKKAAEEFCKKWGLSYKLITEDWLFPK